jgi:AbrB family looped-hinge helix DNA binding protein
VKGRIVRVGRKGVVVIPVDVRESLGIGEGSLLALEVSGGGAIVLKPLKPLRVKLGARVQEIVRESKREELELEESVRPGH